MIVRICNLEGCYSKHHAKGWCKRHYYAERQGRPLVLEDMRGRHMTGRTGNNQSAGKAVKEVPEYRAAHRRVSVERGPASAFPCVECGGKARDWSLNHEATDLLISNEATNVGDAYSLNIFDYSARCRPCHKRYDGRTDDE